MDVRPVIGFVGPRARRGLKKQWHDWAQEAGAHVHIDVYRALVCPCPTCTRSPCMLLRLSEMYTLGRRGYAVAPELGGLALALIDEPSMQALEHRSVDTIVNIGGVLHGTFFGAEDSSDQNVFLKRLAYWRIPPFAPKEAAL